MITFRVATDVKEDRQVLLTLPAEVPTGKTELVVTVAAANVSPRRPRSSLAEWAEENAEHWGEQLNSEDVQGFTGRRF
jgi:hypothetical protein